MPALAILTALYWDRVHPLVFRTTIIMAGVLVAVLAYVSTCLQANVASVKIYPALYWIVLGGTGLLVLAALVVPTMLRSSVLTVVFLLYLCFSGFMRPFDGPLGSYSADVREAVRGRQVWAPSRSNAREESYRFQLPDADIQPYNYELDRTPADLAAKYPLFVVRLSPNTHDPIDGKILGQRFDLGSNHTSGQIIEMIKGKLIDNLFVKELLIETTAGVRRSERAP